ncbi:glycosyltransferase [Patescibacteria group bacterium]
MDRSKTVLVVTHNRVYGIPNALRDYFVSKKHKRVVFIAHPLDNVDGDSYMQIYEQGEKVDEIKIRRSKSLGPINFLIDTLLTIYWVVFKLTKFDIYVGNNNLNALVGVLLRWTRKVGKSIYYTMDFSEDRLGNALLNFVYHKIDVFSIKRSDDRWVVSKGIILAKKEFLNINTKRYPHKIVPTGVWRNIIKPNIHKGFDKNTIFFVGHLLKKQGVQNVLKSLPTVQKKVPGVKMVIVGDGPYRKTLEQITKKLHITDHVVFTGIVKEHKEVFELMSKSCVGMATYEPQVSGKKHFTYYGDPGKIKDYLSVALPIVMTDISYNAKDIENAGCAIVTKYDSKDIAKAILSIMTDANHGQKYRKAAAEKSKEYDWNRIFDKAFRDY